MSPYNWEDIIFFDIETTGFSAKTSFLYLIGCMYFKNNTWQLIQWLADDLNSEPLILKEFFQLLKFYKRLVHFNGSGFDIPFILQKCKKYNLDLSFDLIESYDIYKNILPFKKLLPLPNYKLKTIEAFIGLKRKDIFDGEALIQIYSNYLGRLQYEKLLLKGMQNQPVRLESNMDNSMPPIDKDNTKNSTAKELSETLLLHNKEDITGLLRVADILYYKDFFENFKCDSLICTEETAVPPRITSDDGKNSSSELNITAFLPYSFPQPLSLTAAFPETYTLKGEKICFQKEPQIIKLHLTDNRLVLKVPVYIGELKYFFDNYREYYYLPAEDTVIHKSVAQFVDKDYKVKAKPANCYNKKWGHFVPQTENQIIPSFKNQFSDKISYFELTDQVLADTGRLQEYIRISLRFIRNCKPEFRFE